LEGIARRFKTAHIYEIDSLISVKNFIGMKIVSWYKALLLIVPLTTH